MRHRVFGYANSTTRKQCSPPCFLLVTQKWISQLSENIQAHSMFRVGGRVFRVGEEVGTVDELASAGTVKQHVRAR